MNEGGKSIVLVSSAPAPIGPYSQAIKTSELIFVSGQLGVEVKTGALAADVASQTKIALENIEAILEAAGSGMPRVVKTTIFLIDLADFETVNAVYKNFFQLDPPARSTVQVCALPKGARVEIEAIATCPKSTAQFGSSY